MVRRLEMAKIKAERETRIEMLSTHSVLFENSVASAQNPYIAVPPPLVGTSGY
jgi:hypothetical protein